MMWTNYLAFPFTIFDIYGNLFLKNVPTTFTKKQKCHVNEVITDIKSDMLHQMLKENKN